MPLTIPDDALKSMKMNEREALIEIACRLFAARKLGKPAAARLAGLSRASFEDELVRRGLPILILDEQYWQQEVQNPVLTQPHPERHES